MTKSLPQLALGLIISLLATPAGAQSTKSKDAEYGVRRLLADARLSDASYYGKAPLELTIDPATGDALFFLSEEAAIVRVGLSLDPTSRVLSDPLHGTGPNLAPADVVIEDANDALVADNDNRRILRIDLASGDRSVVSDNSTGTGPALSDPRSIAVDTTNASALVIDGTTLLAIDIATGQRSVVSSTATATIGTGPAIDYYSRLTHFVDASNGRVVVASGARLLAVDLSTGDRTEFSGPGRGAGPLPSGGFANSTYDYQRKRYLALGIGDDVVYAIDAATGDRTLMSGPGYTGPAFSNPTSIECDETTHSALVVDSNAGILAVDLMTGGRRLVQASPMVYVHEFALDDAHRRMLIPYSDRIESLELTARAASDVYRPKQRGSFFGSYALQDLAGGIAYAITGDGAATLDLATGGLTTRSGSGSTPTLTTAVFLDPASRTLYGASLPLPFSSDVPTLFSDAVDTGIRNLLASPSVGSGPVLAQPISGAVDTKRGRALLLDAGLKALLAIDLSPCSTGDTTCPVRMNISGGPVGTGIDWNTPADVRYDAATDKAIVADAVTLVWVDLVGGNRTPLSSTSRGSGAPLGQLNGLVIDAKRRRAIVRSGGTGFVAVDLSTGDRKTLAADPTAEGTYLFSPFGDLDYDPERRAIFAGDTVHPGRALFEVDELSGDWLVIAGRMP